MAGEVFCWRLLIHKLKLNESGPGYYLKYTRFPLLISSHQNINKELLNSVLFLSNEYKDYMKKIIIRKRSIQNLPTDGDVSIILSYISVLNESKNVLFKFKFKLDFDV